MYKFKKEEKISLLSLPENSEVLTHMPREVRKEVMFVFLQLCIVQHIKQSENFYISG